MSERYYVDLPIATNSIRLIGPEAHHLLHVARCRVDDAVHLFDGSGREFEGRVIETGRDWVELQVSSGQEISRELPGILQLAVALPKGNRQHVLVEKLVELGVTSLIPLETSRAVAQPSAGAMERLRRYVIEASKQSGRNLLMSIESPSRCEALFQNSRTSHRLIAHPNGDPWHQVSMGSNCLIAVGPEGGFTDDEVQTARRAGWQVVDLGPRILRVETAAIALAAWAAAQIGRAAAAGEGTADGK